MNIGHSFKYTITNMIVPWGQPLVIFPSCIFSQVENMLIAQAPQERNQQWWHSTGGCPTKVLNCLTQNKTFLFILNETKGARSSDRAYVPQICLSLFRHNIYDGVHKTKQNVLTTTSDHLWSLIIHRLHILVPQELSNRIYLNNHKRSFGERW